MINQVRCNEAGHRMDEGESAGPGKSGDERERQRGQIGVLVSEFESQIGVRN